MKHWTPRRPLFPALFLALALGIASTGCTLQWPWNQPTEETLARTPQPTMTAAATAETTATANATVAAETTAMAQPTPTTVPALAPIEPMKTDETALVRVLLKSLDAPVALGITLTGPYSIENDSGFRFSADTDLSVAIQGEYLYLSCGGLTINMGTSLTLTRVLSDDPHAGLIIHETGRENIYCGDLKLTADEGAIMPVLTLDIEDYLYGVVPNEMSDSFPVEALKAQAVAARTYAMSRKAGAGSRAYDVVDTTGDQVFRGLNPDTENAIKAVDATRGVVGMYKGAYATCYFAASNGGQTALPDQIWGNDGDYGYLDVRDDPYDLQNPSSVVKTLTLSADGSQLSSRLAKTLKSGLAEQMAALGCSEELNDIGIVKVLSVTPAAPKFGEGNRMYTRLDVSMQVRAKKFTQLTPEEAAVSSATYRSDVVVLDQPLTASLDIYNDLKSNYGLKINASDCEVTSVQVTADASGNVQSFDIQTRRFGHGIGMSQRGAQQMAGTAGFTWRQIIAFYYPGMTLAEMDYIRKPLQALDALPENLGRARPRPTPEPTPAPLPALAAGEYYARVTLGSKSSTLNVRAEPSTSAAIKGVIDHGARLIVMEELDSGWAHIKTAELEGYVSSEYIEKES
jgi:SpoIID/LytB domain protein